MQAAALQSVSCQAGSCNALAAVRWSIFRLGRLGCPGHSLTMAAAPDAHASAARPEGVAPTKAGTLQQCHVVKLIHSGALSGWVPGLGNSMLIRLTKKPSGCHCLSAAVMGNAPDGRKAAAPDTRGARPRRAAAQQRRAAPRSCAHLARVHAACARPCGG